MKKRTHKLTEGILISLILHCQMLKNHNMCSQSFQGVYVFMTLQRFTHTLIAARILVKITCLYKDPQSKTSGSSPKSGRYLPKVSNCIRLISTLYFQNLCNLTLPHIASWANVYRQAEKFAKQGWARFFSGVLPIKILKNSKQCTIF